MDVSGSEAWLEIFHESGRNEYLYQQGIHYNTTLVFREEARARSIGWLNGPRSQPCVSHERRFPF